MDGWKREILSKWFEMDDLGGYPHDLPVGNLHSGRWSDEFVDLASELLGLTIFGMRSQHE